MKIPLVCLYSPLLINFVHHYWELRMVILHTMPQNTKTRHTPYVTLTLLLIWKVESLLSVPMVSVKVHSWSYSSGHWGSVQAISTETQDCHFLCSLNITLINSSCISHRLNNSWKTSQGLLNKPIEVTWDPSVSPVFLPWDLTISCQEVRNPESPLPCLCGRILTSWSSINLPTIWISMQSTH